MRTKWFIVLTIMGAATAWTDMSVYAQDQEETREADKGQASIDVSGYPEEIQAAYEVFAERCSKCHTLARPINSAYKGDEWRRYVRRMMRKVGSGINPGNRKEIIAFLVYDSEHRKKNK